MNDNDTIMIFIYILLGLVALGFVIFESIIKMQVFLHLLNM